MNLSNVTLSFALNEGYASKEECIFHLSNPHLTLITDKPYKATFYDEDGTPFRAYPDFYHAESRSCIEFKASQLNTCKTKSDSQQKLDKQEAFKGSLKFYDKLKWGWNHSLYKQAKVQSSLAATGSRMLVVFADNTKISTQNKNTMKRAGLKWCFEQDLEQYLSL